MVQSCDVLGLRISKYMYFKLQHIYLEHKSDKWNIPSVFFATVYVGRDKYDINPKGSIRIKPKVKAKNAIHLIVNIVRFGWEN